MSVNLFLMLEYLFFLPLLKIITVAWGEIIILLLATIMLEVRLPDLSQFICILFNYKLIFLRQKTKNEFYLRLATLFKFAFKIQI